jgi:HEAT repeat protein
MTGGVSLIMDRRKTVLTIILITIYIAIFCAPLHSFAETSIDFIQTWLKSLDIEKRIAAVEQLGQRKDEKAVDLLMSIAGNRREDWQVQVKAIQLLGEAKDPRAVDVLLRVFKSRNRDWECPAIKSYTALALSNFGDQPGVTDALIKGTEDGELLTREASVRALGIIRSEKATPHLIALLRDGSVAIRLSAIKALENIGDRKALPELEIVAENDKDQSVRDTAKAALANFRKS